MSLRPASQTTKAGAFREQVWLGSPRASSTLLPGPAPERNSDEIDCMCCACRSDHAFPWRLLHAPGSRTRRRCYWRAWRRWHRRSGVWRQSWRNSRWRRDRRCWWGRGWRVDCASAAKLLLSSRAKKRPRLTLCRWAFARAASPSPSKTRTTSRSPKSILKSSRPSAWRVNSGPHPQLDELKFYENGGTISLVPEPCKAGEETLMQRIVSTAKAIASSSTVRTFVRMPVRIVRQVMAAPTAFIDAIERFATKY